MIRTRSLLVVALTLALGAAFVAEAQAQRTRGGSRGSLLGLLSIEQVQKELRLDGDAVKKVTELGAKIRAEMTEQYSAIREIEDREKQRAKYAELRDQSDRKAREGLRDVLAREQIMRLYQIRMQVRAAIDSLGNRYVAGRLKLTDEQKEKLAEVGKESQAEQSKLYGSFRDASEEQRTELFAKFRKIRSDGDEKALGLLTAEQKEAFEKMNGEKIELPSRRGR